LPVLDVTAFVPAVDFFAFPGGAFVCPGAPGWAGGLALSGGVVTGGLALPGGVLVAPGGVFVDPGGVRDSLVSASRSPMGLPMMWSARVSGGLAPASAGASGDCLAPPSRWALPTGSGPARLRERPPAPPGR
jgi:hypothetical protein